MGFPNLRQTVLDSTDNRRLAEFYRELLGWDYRSGDEPPVEQEWLVIVGPAGQRLAFAQVPALPTVTWPDGPVSQQLHLDFTVPDKADLDAQHERALALGATLLEDRSDDDEEPLRVYADPAGHPFCIFC
jgi:catechol 2,3-dioxygenase-like lactoylglutathione lyase family enzyme